MNGQRSRILLGSIIYVVIGLNFTGAPATERIAITIQIPLDHGSDIRRRSVAPAIAGEPS